VITEFTHFITLVLTESASAYSSYYYSKTVKY